MKSSCSSHANKRLYFSLLSFLLLFLRGLFFEQWAPTYFILCLLFSSCHEQCCLFEFPNLVVILKHSLRFINSIPYPMADPSPPFVSALMMLVLKRDSLHIPNKNIFSFSLLHRVFSLKHYHTFTPINHYTMTPVKSQGSSRGKGKEIASDDPAIRNVGEEAAHSDSDHFDEEEARRDPNSKCTPLIDPWYDTYVHFPKVPGEYTPLGCVWFALCRRNTDISWAPLASSIPDLVIR